MASGNTLLIFTPQANQPPAANYATPDVRNSLLVLDFDAAVDEHAVFVGVLPRNYDGGGITVYLHFMFSSATSGTGRFIAAIERHLAGTDDSDVDSFAAGVSGEITAISPSGTEIIIALVFTAGAQMDNLAVGERFRLKVTRDADGTTGIDNAPGDAELVAVEIKET